MVVKQTRPEEVALTCVAGCRWIRSCRSHRGLSSNLLPNARADTSGRIYGTGVEVMRTPSAANAAEDDEGAVMRDVCRQRQNRGNK